VRRAVLAGAIVALTLATAARSANAAVGIVRLEATLTPSPALFGQPVTAELDVFVNTKKADPASVQTRARFLPYTLVDAPLREDERDGNVARVRYTYRLACDSLDCTTGAKRERRLEFQPALVRYRSADGHARTVTAPWSALRLVSRVGDSQFRPQTATEAERGLPTAPLLELAADVSPPSPTYRFAPSTVAIVLFVAALIALAGAVWLAVPVVALTRTRTNVVEELSPLERALASVDHSSRREPGSAEHREALALLARELRRAGMSDLVSSARRLAWSEQAPTEAESRRLVTEVRAGSDAR
jgi:hypothetical protein